jgi:hypothetical protein
VPQIFCSVCAKDFYGSITDPDTLKTLQQIEANERELRELRDTWRRILNGMPPNQAVLLQAYLEEIGEIEPEDEGLILNLKELRRQAITEAIRRTSTRAQAAKLLGISVPALQQYLHKGGDSAKDSSVGRNGASDQCVSNHGADASEQSHESGVHLNGSSRYGRTIDGLPAGYLQLHDRDADHGRDGDAKS